MHHFPVGLDILWQPQSHAIKLSSHMQSWLVDTGSLTERIQSLCSLFEVDVVGQGVAPLYDHEEQALRSDEPKTQPEQFHVREVVLMADNQPWVFARSIIPKALTEGEWQNMGSSPLGRRLFNDNRFVRGEFEIGSLSTGHFASILPITTPELQLFGRRSIFTFNSHKVLVAEVFLPHCPVYQTSDTPL